MNLYTFYKKYMFIFRINKLATNKEYVAPMTLLQFMHSINLDIKKMNTSSILSCHFQKALEYYQPVLSTFSEYTDNQKLQFFSILQAIDPNKEWESEIQNNIYPEAVILKALTVYYPFNKDLLNIPDDMPFNPWFYICLNALTINLKNGYPSISFAVPFNAMPYLYSIVKNPTPNFPLQNIDIYNRYISDNVYTLSQYFFSCIKNHYQKDLSDEM